MVLLALQSIVIVAQCKAAQRSVMQQTKQQSAVSQSELLDNMSMLCEPACLQHYASGSLGAPSKGRCSGMGAAGAGVRFFIAFWPNWLAASELPSKGSFGPGVAAGACSVFAISLAGREGHARLYQLHKAWACNKGWEQLIMVWLYLYIAGLLPILMFCGPSSYNQIRLQ